MGFNLFLYAFIVFALLVGKSYDYPTTHEENDDNCDTDK